MCGNDRAAWLFVGNSTREVSPPRDFSQHGGFKEKPTHQGVRQGGVAGEDELLAHHVALEAGEQRSIKKGNRKDCKSKVSRIITYDVTDPGKDGRAIMRTIVGELPRIHDASATG